MAKASTALLALSGVAGGARNFFGGPAAPRTKWGIRFARLLYNALGLNRLIQSKRMKVIVSNKDQSAKKPKAAGSTLFTKRL